MDTNIEGRDDQGDDQESDSDSFVDALEEMCMKDDNPVKFQQSHKQNLNHDNVHKENTEMNVNMQQRCSGVTDSSDCESSQFSNEHGKSSSDSSQFIERSDVHLVNSDVSTDTSYEQDPCPVVRDAVLSSETHNEKDSVKENSDSEKDIASEENARVEEQISEATGISDDTSVDNEAVEDDENDVIDEEEMKKQEELLSEEEKEARKDQAQTLKTEGNERFKAANYHGAVESYTEALMICPLCFKKERSIMYSNRAASKMKLGKDSAAVEDCTKALDYHPHYLKALLRRAELHEKLEQLEDALADYGRALELDPSLSNARQACQRLPGQIEERNEKMKAEMLGKLKDLGNMVLRPFGLSTNNFNLQKDPNTGSYSVQFQQNAAPPTNGK